MRHVLGWILVVTPLLVVALLLVLAMGWRQFLVGFVFSVGMSASIAYGVYLLAGKPR